VPVRQTILTFATLFSAAPVAAQDTHHGESEFRKCAACHAITAPDGTEIRKGGSNGPNLYGVIGRQIGTLPGYEFSASLVAAGADGTVWDAANMGDFLHDPRAWVIAKTGDPAARTSMAFREATGVEDVAGYLGLFGAATQ
jgi:cytochrome c